MDIFIKGKDEKNFFVLNLNTLQGQWPERFSLAFLRLYRKDWLAMEGLILSPLTKPPDNTSSPTAGPLSHVGTLLSLDFSFGALGKFQEWWKKSQSTYFINKHTRIHTPRRSSERS